MAAEDFYLNLSPLPSPRWSPLRLTPSPPRPFLPSSNSNYSMVMQYQGSNQSMDDPPQNQEQDDIVDPAPYFPPSPTNFPLYPPMPSVFVVSREQEDISLALSYQHILEDKSGALHVLNWEESPNIIELLFDDFMSYMQKKFFDLREIATAAGVVPKGVKSLVDYIWKEEDYDEMKVTLRRINWFEQDDVDIVDQPVYELLAVVQQQIQNRGGELDVILGGGVYTINGLEQRDGQGLPTTPEPLLIRQAKVSYRVWLAHDGQWTVEIRWRCSHLNNGSFTTVEDAISAYEMVVRLSGWKDLTGTRNDEIESTGTGSEETEDCIMADQVRLNSGCLGKRKTKEKNPGGERRSKKTNGVRIAIPPEDILQTKGMSFKEAANHLGAEAVGKWSGGRNKKNAISLEDILRCKEMPQKVAAMHLKVSLSTLKRACRGHGILIWPSCGEHNQSRPNEYPAVVDNEQIPQLKSDMLLPSNQVLTTTGTESVTMNARFGKHTIKFQLSWPFETEELKQQVKKRLELEAGTYYINYKDEDNDDILIGCDEDLKAHISRSCIPGTNSIEVFLQPK